MPFVLNVKYFIKIQRDISLIEISLCLLSPDNCPRTIPPQENCPVDNCPQGKLLPENCPLTIKFPSKILSPAQGNSPQRALRVNWGKLCIVYEYYNMRALQLRSKNRFTSIYFLQILTNPGRTLLITEHFSLNVSRFSPPERKKMQFFGKIDSKKKIKKTS